MSGLAYRAIVYKPRSLNDASESQVLVPVGAGAAIHTNPFQVSTLQNDPGYQPYLMLPTGRTGRVDYVSKKTDVGTVILTLLDARTNRPDNTKRWVTAFLGDSAGRNNLIGCKVLVWESLDGGTTWTSYFGGRITGVDLSGRLSIALTVSDTVNDLSALAFCGLPHASITYAAPPLLWPLGLSVTYGGFPKAPSLGGTFSTTNNVVTLNTTARGSASNQVTAAFMGLAQPVSSGSKFLDLIVMRYDFRSGTFNQPMVRVRLTVSGVTHDYRLVGVTLVRDKTWRLTSFSIDVLDASAAGYGALPANNATITAIQMLGTASPTKDAPLIIGDVAPYTLWKDLLDGKFGWLDDTGAVLRSFAYDAAAFASPPAGIPGTGRWIVTGRTKMNDWIEKNICIPFNLAYRINESGQVEPMWMGLSNTVSVAATITDDDLDANTVPKWGATQSTAYPRAVVKLYRDTYTDPLTLLGQPDANGFAPAPPALIASEEVTVEVIDAAPRQADLGDGTLTLDFPAFRGQPVPILENGTGSFQYQALRAMRVLQEYRTPFASGARATTLTCRRTANSHAAVVGSVIVASPTVLPDPLTDVRGAARYVRVLERSERGATCELRCQDLGSGATAATPTFGSPAVVASGAISVLSIPLTLNAQENDVEVQWSITSTATGTRPTDEGTWITLGVAHSTIAFPTTATLYASLPPKGSRAWLRGRSIVSGGGILLPSAWVYPTANYIDIGALTAPTSVVVSSIASTSAIATFAFSVLGYATEVYLTVGGIPGTWLSTQKIATIPAGYMSCTLTGLTASTGYAVGIRNVDGVGGASGFASTTFTTTAVAPVLPLHPPPRIIFL